MIEVAIVGFLGVILGALIVIITLNLRMRLEERQAQKKREVAHKVKEIESLLLLNKKVNEILQKRTFQMEEYVNFTEAEDCFITIDDLAYLQSYVAHNTLYLPNYLFEEFMKKISQRKVVLTPEETLKVGGYVYKESRFLVVAFSDELLTLVAERKAQLQKLSDQGVTYLN
ncbi:MAG: hypothetical protein ACK5MW_03320 [Enterococcus sp.]